MLFSPPLSSPPELPFAADGVALESLPAGFRLSVMYQPEPLNTIPAGKSTRRTGPPHSGHSVTGGSAKRWERSKRCLQAVHSYS